VGTQSSCCREQRGEAALSGTSLSLPLNHLLDAVVAEPGVTVTEIARRLGKSQQAVSQAADRLERSGFIERHGRVGYAPGPAHGTPDPCLCRGTGHRRHCLPSPRLASHRSLVRFPRADLCPERDITIWDKAHLAPTLLSGGAVVSMDPVVGDGKCAGPG
jgi:hypothetical protein